MKACATAGGGVMFIPDELERKNERLSFAALLKEESQEKPAKPYGRRKNRDNPIRRAA